jgi:hypothetical protein
MIDRDADQIAAAFHQGDPWPLRNASRPYPVGVRVFQRQLILLSWEDFSLLAPI